MTKKAPKPVAEPPRGRAQQTAPPPTPAPPPAPKPAKTASKPAKPTGGDYAAFHAMDVDGDGFVSREEFLAAQGLGDDEDPERVRIREEEAAIEAEIARFYASPKGRKRTTSAINDEGYADMNLHHQVADAARKIDRTTLDDSMEFGTLIPMILDLEKLGAKVGSLTHSIRRDILDSERTASELETSTLDDRDLQSLITNLGKFEGVLAEVSDAQNARECEPLVKMRRAYCKTLIEPAKQYQKSQAARAKRLQERFVRLDSTMKLAVAAIGPTRIDTSANTGSADMVLRTTRDVAKYIVLQKDGLPYTGSSDGTDAGNSDSCTFGPVIQDLLNRILDHSGADAKVFMQLMQGATLDLNEVATREAARLDAEASLFAIVQDASTACRVFMAEATAYLDNETARMKEAEDVEHLLTEKIELLDSLPALERTVMDQLKEMRRLDKAQRKLEARIVAVENRMDEADQLKGMSSDSADEDWSDDDKGAEEFVLGNLHEYELKEKLDALIEQHTEIVELKKEVINDLIQITDELPELRYHPKLKSAVAVYNQEKLKTATKSAEAIRDGKRLALGLDEEDVAQDLTNMSINDLYRITPAQ